MPDKHNDDRRHHIAKMRFWITNWAAYEAGLRCRGSLTLWVSDAAMDGWRAVPRMTPGGQARYSGTAIETAVMVRHVFHQSLRQTEGSLGSLRDLVGVDLPVPDHTTIRWRAALRTPALSTVLPTGPITLVIDSTGLKVFGAGEWSGTVDQDHSQAVADGWEAEFWGGIIGRGAFEIASLFIPFGGITKAGKLGVVARTAEVAAEARKTVHGTEVAGQLASKTAVDAGRAGHVASTAEVPPLPTRYLGGNGKKREHKIGGIQIYRLSSSHKP